LQPKDDRAPSDAIGSNLRRFPYVPACGRSDRRCLMGPDGSGTIRAQVDSASDSVETRQSGLRRLGVAGAHRHPPALCRRL